MMGVAQHGAKDRATSAAAVLLAHAVIGYLLITGFGLSFTPPTSDALQVFDTRTPPPPPPVEKVIPPPKAPAKEPEGEAAPPNLKSQATPIVAPKPEVKIERPPPPIPAAPVPREGFDRSQGAAPVPGPGTGAGGTGNGTGSGGRGTGTGGGGAGGGGSGGERRLVQHARQIAGSLSRRDYPAALREAGVGGRVVTHLTVEPSGRVSGCKVVQSSGYPELDTITCRLVIQRYRYEPARDAEGRPMRDLVGVPHIWFAGRRRD